MNTERVDEKEAREYFSEISPGGLSAAAVSWRKAMKLVLKGYEERKKVLIYYIMSDLLISGVTVFQIIKDGKAGAAAVMAVLTGACFTIRAVFLMESQKKKKRLLLDAAKRYVLFMAKNLRFSSEYEEEMQPLKRMLEDIYRSPSMKTLQKYEDTAETPEKKG